MDRDARVSPPPARANASGTPDLACCRVDPADPRYSRQVRLAQVGAAGQARLSRASVLVLGLGALGSVVAELLARAGVGRLLIVDRDVVEPSNLQRQTLYTPADVGSAKAEAAERRLRDINPDVDVQAHGIDADAGWLLAHLPAVDVAVDATDNATTRYILNDAAVACRRPWVYGGAVGTQGRAAAFAPERGGACLRCVYPTPPAPGELETCDTAGVFSGVTAAVAAWQVQLTLRLLLEPNWSPRQLVWLDGWSLRTGTLDLGETGCDTCRGTTRAFLHTPPAPAVQLCGRNTVQVRPARPGRTDLIEVERRWRSLGSVHLTPYLLRVLGPSPDLPEGVVRATLFADGRLLLEGPIAAADVARLRSVYDRLVGG